MKKWYYKLKESENYNVIILAVLAALTIKLVHYIYLTGVNIHDAIAWDMFDAYGFMMIGTAVAAVLFFAMAIAFVIQAVKKDPKFMICAIVSLTVAAVMGVSLCAVQCIIACVYWFWVVKVKPDKQQYELVKLLTGILIVVSVGAFAVWEISYWVQFGFDSLQEEGLLALSRLHNRVFNPEVLLIAYLFKHSVSKSFRNLCKLLAVIWVLMTLWMIVDTYILSWFNMGAFEEWGPESSIEAGDWSEWETEEDLQYYDEEGNGATYQTFEFE